MKPLIFSFFRLVRLPNLLLIAFTLMLLRIVLGNDVQISDSEFFVLVFGTVLIAAAGNIINDIFDLEIDKINKPHQIVLEHFISIPTAWKIYFMFNFIACFGAILWIGDKGVSVFFIAVIFLLFFYSKYWKKQALVGNLVIAILCAWVVVLFGWIERNSLDDYWFWILSSYAVFAFFSTLFREQIKDLEDMEGDAQFGAKTLPIAIGENKAKLCAVVTAILLLFFLFLELFFLCNYQKYTAIFYLIGLLILPLIYLIFKILYAKNKENYHQLSLWAKGYMLLGLVLLLLV